MYQKLINTAFIVFLGELKGMIKIIKRDGKVVKIGVKG